MATGHSLASQSGFLTFQANFLNPDGSEKLPLYRSRPNRNLSGVEALGLLDDPAMKANLYFKGLMEAKGRSAKLNLPGDLLAEVNRLLALGGRPTIPDPSKMPRGDYVKEVIRLGLVGFNSYSTGIAAQAEMILESARIVNRALAALNPPQGPLEEDAGGNTLLLLETAALLGLDGSTPYLASLAMKAGGVVESALVVNRALAALNPPQGPLKVDARGHARLLLENAVFLDLDGSTPYLTRLSRDKVGREDAVLLINRALAALNPPQGPLKKDAAGRALLLLKTAVLLDLDGSTPYLASLAVVAGGRVESTLLINRALAALNPPQGPLGEGTDGRTLNLLDNAVTLGQATETPYLRKLLLQCIQLREMSLERLKQSSASLQSFGLEPWPSTEEDNIVKGTVRDLLSTPDLSMITIFAATCERGDTPAGGGRFGPEAIAQANYTHFRRVFTELSEGGLTPQVFLITHGLKVIRLLKLRNPAIQYYREAMAQQIVIDSGSFPYQVPSSGRLRMFRSSGVGNAEGTLHMLGADVGVYAMIKTGTLPPLAASSTAAGAKRPFGE